MVTGIPRSELGASLQGGGVTRVEHRLLQIVEEKQSGEQEKWLLATRSVEGGQCEYEDGTLYFDLTCRVEAWWLDEDHRRKKVTSMGVRISSVGKSASIHDGIFVDHLKGMHIGSFCLNWLLEWVRAAGPGFIVYFPELLAAHAYESNRERRNKCYETFGFKFDWVSVDGVEKSAGKAQPIKANDLLDHRYWKKQDWPKIKVFGLEVGFEKMMKQNEAQARELTQTKARFDRASERLARKDSLQLKTMGRVYRWGWILAFLLGALSTYFVVKSGVMTMMR
jgi:GNAT superfamily N-acetyltransferase